MMSSGAPPRPAAGYGIMVRRSGGELIAEGPGAITMHDAADLNAFFQEFAGVVHDADSSRVASLYTDPFTFGSEQGVQSVKLADFLRVLPRRQGFFAAIGLKATRVVAVEAEPLGNRYTRATVTWRFEYEPDGKAPIQDEGKATYILLRQDGQLRIAVQIDHQDLAQRAKDLGIG